jgi:hypothetical protein
MTPSNDHVPPVSPSQRAHTRIIREGLEEISLAPENSTGRSPLHEGQGIASSPLPSPAPVDTQTPHRLDRERERASEPPLGSDPCPARDVFGGTRVNTPEAADSALPERPIIHTCQLVDCNDPVAGTVDISLRHCLGVDNLPLDVDLRLVVCASHLRMTSAKAIIGFGFTPEYSPAINGKAPKVF